MKDRVSLYPGRVTLTPVSGQQNTYDMARADQPTQVGTPLNTNTLLKDSTAALYGLGTNATPDEVLQAIANKLDTTTTIGIIEFVDFSNIGISKEANITVGNGVNKVWPAVARTPDYLIFSGGGDGNYGTRIVNAYNSELVNQSSISDLLYSTEKHAGASVGSRVVFAGGRYDRDETPTQAKANSFSNSLVRTEPSSLSVARRDLAAATAGTSQYAVFAGGSTSGNAVSATTVSDAVDAYDSSLVKTTPSALYVARSGLAASSAGTYVIFAGGDSGDGAVSSVDAYSASLIHSSVASLSSGRFFLASTSPEEGEKALFGGGDSGAGTGESDIIDTYNSLLVKLEPIYLSVARGSLSATSIDFSIFAGGEPVGTTTSSKIVDAFSSDLIRVSIENLEEGSKYLASGSIGKYGLFYGGSTGGQYSFTSDISVYTAQYSYSISIPPMSAYMFDGITDEETVTFSGTTLSGTGTLNGYIKPTGFTLSGYYPQG